MSNKDYKQAAFVLCEMKQKSKMKVGKCKESQLQHSMFLIQYSIFFEL